MDACVQRQIFHRWVTTGIQYVTTRGSAMIQHTDQLSPDNKTRVWTADEEKTPCEGHLGLEYSPEMQ